MKNLLKIWHDLNKHPAVKGSVITGSCVVIAAIIGLFGYCMKQPAVETSISDAGLVEISDQKTTQGQFQLSNNSGYLTINNYWQTDPPVGEVAKTQRIPPDEISQKKTQQEDVFISDSLLGKIFDRFKLEIIKADQIGKIAIIKRNDRLAFVLLVLEHVPLPQTIELQWYIYNQPASSYSAFKNVVLFNWGDDVSKLSTKNFTIRYIADFSKDNEKVRLRRTDDFVYVGDKIAFRLSDGKPFNIIKKKSGKKAAS